MWANLKGNTITNVMQLWQNTVIQITELRETLRDTKYRRWPLKSIQPLMKLLFLKHARLPFSTSQNDPKLCGGVGGEMNRTQNSTKNLKGNKIILWTHFLYQTSLFSDNPAVILCCFFFNLVVDLGWHWRNQPIKMDVVTEKSDEDDDNSDSICNYHL